MSFNQGAVTAVQVVPEQLYSVVLAVPSVRKYSDPGPLGDVPQAAEGAPVPAEIDAPPCRRSWPAPVNAATGTGVAPPEKKLTPEVPEPGLSLKLTAPEP